MLHRSAKRPSGKRDCGGTPDEGVTGVGSVSEGAGVGGVGADEGVDVERKARRVGSRSRRGSVEELC